MAGTGVVWDRLARAAGGRPHARVVLLLACVLGLDTADVSTVGAIGGKLEHALSLTNTELGLLAATPSILAAVATVPVGVCADRINRVRMIWISIIVWAIAQAASGAAQSFATLLAIRMALGAATATAGPPVTSLVGDYFPAARRARIWGLILSGELVGAAFGYVISGEFAALGSWRYAFFVLAAPSLLAAFAVRRWLGEPARGAEGRDEDEFEQSEAQERVEERSVQPDTSLVLRSDPARMGLWRATRYVLRIPTNVVLIVASALGYFYFTGVQTFGLVFFEDRYHVSQGTATALLALLGLGGLVGVVAGGRLADRLLHEGNVDGRIIVGGASYLLAAILFFPGLLSGAIAVSLPFYFAAGAAFGAREPPLDAARQDIVHHRLWGRAEAVRTVLRRVVTASAPVVFGLIADQLASGRAAAGQHGFGAGANAHGLRLAFLILLVTLAAGGALTFMARRTFSRDVATAVASEEATAARAAA